MCLLKREKGNIPDKENIGSVSQIRREVTGPLPNPFPQRLRAASIKQATFALSIIVGPALASPLYFTVGPVIAILINAVSYLVSVFCLLFLRAPQAALHPHAFRQDDKADSGIGGILCELLAGLKFVVVTRIVLMVTLMALIAMLGAGALNALNIVFTSKNLHIETALYGVLTAVGGLGASWASSWRGFSPGG